MEMRKWREARGRSEQTTRTKRIGGGAENSSGGFQQWCLGPEGQDGPLLARRLGFNSSCTPDFMAPVLEEGRGGGVSPVTS
jgi:hypothetical protein